MVKRTRASQLRENFDGYTEQAGRHDHGQDGLGASGDEVAQIVAEGIEVFKIGFGVGKAGFQDSKAQALRRYRQKSLRSGQQRRNVIRHHDKERSKDQFPSYRSRGEPCVDCVHAVDGNQSSRPTPPNIVPPCQRATLLARFTSDRYRCGILCQKEIVDQFLRAFIFHVVCDIEGAVCECQSGCNAQ